MWDSIDQERIKCWLKEKEKDNSGRRDLAVGGKLLLLLIMSV
jgi:hypothetical protein